MTHAIPLLRVRKRRRKPWRPATKVALALVFFCGLIAVLLLSPIGGGVGPIDVFLGCWNTCSAAWYWQIFQRLRKEDERD